MFSLNCNGKFLYAQKPLVMGILNINNESFYKNSRLHDEGEIVAKAEKMILEGADILDIGGQSTRPGSERINAHTEQDIVIPVIQKLKSSFPDTILSIDTYHASVAKNAVLAGASMVNDISGGEMDKKMIRTVGELHVPYICMHMKGVPETMHLNTEYKDILKEIIDFFILKVYECREAGINDVIIDPGFGFGKNISQNLFLLKNLSVFKILGKPLLCGLSRKSTIYKTLQTTPEDALNGTTVLNTLALLHGADILRVHDVKEAREAIRLMEAYEMAK